MPPASEPLVTVAGGATLGPTRGSLGPSDDRRGCVVNGEIRARLLLKADFVCRALRLASDSRRSACNPPAEGEGDVEQVDREEACLAQELLFRRRAEERQTFNHHPGGGHRVRGAGVSLLAKGGRSSQPALGIPNRRGVVRNHQPCTGLQAIADSLQRPQPLASVQEMQRQQACCAVERVGRRLVDRPFQKTDPVRKRRDRLPREDAASAGSANRERASSSISVPPGREHERSMRCGAGKCSIAHRQGDVSRGTRQVAAGEDACH